MTRIASRGQQKVKRSNFNSGKFCVAIKDNDFHSISIIFTALK